MHTHTHTHTYTKRLIFHFHEKKCKKLGTDSKKCRCRLKRLANVENMSTPNDDPIWSTSVHPLAMRSYSHPGPGGDLCGTGAPHLPEIQILWQRVMPVLYGLSERSAAFASTNVLRRRRQCRTHTNNLEERPSSFLPIPVDGVGQPLPSQGVQSVSRVQIDNNCEGLVLEGQNMGSLAVDNHQSGGKMIMILKTQENDSPAAAGEEAEGGGGRRGKG